MIFSVLLPSLIAAVAAAQRPEPAVASASHADAGVQASAVSRADSLRALRDARRAQEHFEAVRRMSLPFGSGGYRGPCDLQVGRLCYWHDDGAPTPEIAEPPRIGEARGRLLDALDNAGRRVPGDAWIVGQRVRYLAEAGRGDEAINAARHCRAESWWCSALAGFAHHRAGQFADAEEAFDRALLEMAERQRCEWSDVSMFLDGSTARRYRSLPCAEREPLEQRFWWLSRPLFGMSGNDLRTEFLARRTMSRLEEGARSAYNLSWGPDVEELLMRFGWPTWWTREHSQPASGAPAYTITGHEPTPSFYFHPDSRLVTGDPGDATMADWQPRMARPPARYAPRYAKSFSSLDARVAVFRRRDSAVVVARYEAPRDSLFDGGDVEAVLALSDDDSSVTVVRETTRGGESKTLVAVAAWKPMLVSVELRAPRTGGVARARMGVTPDDPDRRRGRLGLSDILLYDAARGRPASLDEAAAWAVHDATAGATRRVGVYWEMYGLRPAGEPLEITLVVESTRRSWSRRAAERLGLTDRITPLRVRWREVPQRDAGYAARAITVDLSTLPAGQYRMRLTIAAEDGSSAVSERIVALAAHAR